MAPAEIAGDSLGQWPFIHLMHQLCPFLGLEICSLPLMSKPFLNWFTATPFLLQHENTEEYSEFWRILQHINDFKIHMHNFECCKTCQCSTVRCITFVYATRIQLKRLVITLKNLHGMGPGFMWDYLSPRVSAHSTKSDRFSRLQASSFNHCHHAGLRWYAFSNIAFSCETTWPLRFRKHQAEGH